MILDVKLNDIGNYNGSFDLYVYNQEGKNIGRYGEGDITFRSDANWKILGPYMSQRQDYPSPRPRIKTEYLYTSDYAMYEKNQYCE